MRLVLDTGVLLSAFFRGGFSRQVLEAVVRGQAAACATREIVAEYEAAFAKVREGKPEPLNENLLLPFTARLHIVRPKPGPALCRDEAVGRFLACARAAHALYVVGEDQRVSPTGSRTSTILVKPEGVCLLLGLTA